MYVSFFQSNLALFGISGSHRLKEAGIALKKMNTILYSLQKDKGLLEIESTPMQKEGTQTCLVRALFLGHGPRHSPSRHKGKG